MGIAYDNIMGHPDKGQPPKLTDAEIDKIIETLIVDINA